VRSRRVSDTAALNTLPAYSGPSRGRRPAPTFRPPRHGSGPEGSRNAEVHACRGTTHSTTAPTRSPALGAGQERPRPGEAGRRRQPARKPGRSDRPRRHARWSAARPTTRPHPQPDHHTNGVRESGASSLRQSSAIRRSQRPGGEQVAGAVGR
jgi:hypothetical protein